MSNLEAESFQKPSRVMMVSEDAMYAIEVIKAWRWFAHCAYLAEAPTRFWRRIGGGVNDHHQRATANQAWQSFLWRMLFSFFFSVFLCSSPSSAIFRNRASCVNDRCFETLKSSTQLFGKFPACFIFIPISVSTSISAWSVANYVV